MMDIPDIIFHLTFLKNMNLALGYGEFEGVPLKATSSAGDMKF